MAKKIPKKNKNQNQNSYASDEIRRKSLNFVILNATSAHNHVRLLLQQFEENKDDLISNLPDDILLHLLSLIPFESALQTNALSNRWRIVWNKAFTQHGTKEGIDCAVADFLLDFDHHNPLQHPRILNFHFGRGLILSATIGLRKKLHLKFCSEKQAYYPRQFGWFLVLNSFDPSHQPSPSAFFVKTLNLTSVTYLTNEIVSSLVSNFHNLESLTIANCVGLRSLRVDAVSKLKNFTVLDCPQLNSLFIEAYELKSFRCRGRLCWFSLTGVHSWEDCMLDFRAGPAYKAYKYLHYDSLLLAIENVKILTLSGWFFEAIISPWLSSGHENLRFNNLTDLWWINTTMEESKIDALVSLLKICPSLERLFINIDPTSYCIASTVCHPCSEQVNRARPRHLKAVKLEGFTNEEDAIVLKEHLLEVFNLEPLIITASNGKLLCLIKIPKQQSKNSMKKGRPQSKKRKCSYKFVEEVEDNIVGQCSKHPHMGL
ncbi:unnamed protein product [Camellia sinensis]